MNILICDDVKSETERLARLLSDSGFDVNTVVCHNGTEVLNFAHTKNVIDVCFLDIIMPGMSGIDLARELREDGYTGEIVFLTTSNEFAAESYAVNTFSYLLKPPTLCSVRDVLSKLENARKSGDTDGITVQTKSIISFILFRDIEYAEVINHKVYFHLKNGDDVGMSATFAEVLPQVLRDPRFAQCHSSYIVNMNDIAAIAGREITMRGGAKIPISKSYAQTKKRYLDWRLETHKR